MKIKVSRVIVTKEEMQDLKGIGISKGTRLGVVKEAPKHPTENYRIVVVRVDNGTVDDADGDWSLCPETAIREKVK